MSRSRLAALIPAAALAIASLGTPAVAETPFEPILVDTPTFLQCDGSTKVTQVNSLVDGSGVATWAEQAPTASVQSGAGCGNADTFLGGAGAGNEIYDFVMSGQFQGNLDAFDLELHAIDTATRATGEFALRVSVAIDGKTLLEDEEIRTQATTSSTGASESLILSFTDVDLLTEADHLATHQIDITVKTLYVNVSGVNGWVWGTTEVPSGLHFNPDKAGGQKIKL